MNNSTYKTKQKDIILSFLKSNYKEHFTVEDLHDMLKSSGNKVSKSTIYRYLDKLELEGKVRKYVLKEQSSACYEYVENPEDDNTHFHIQCSECGDLLNIDCNYFKEMISHVMAHHNFNIDYSKTVFYGTCCKCSKNENDNK